jgi:hypothetical protein
MRPVQGKQKLLLQPHDCDPTSNKQDREMSKECKQEHIPHMSQNRTVCTSMYIDKLSKSVSTQIYDVALPFLKMLFTLIPIVPILLTIKKDEKTGCFHTHFLFFTNKLARNLKHYMSTAAETLKPKERENNMVILMCQNIKSTPSYTK